LLRLIVLVRAQALWGLLCLRMLEFWRTITLHAYAADQARESDLLKQALEVFWINCTLVARVFGSVPEQPGLKLDRLGSVSWPVGVMTWYLTERCGSGAEGC